MLNRPFWWFSARAVALNTLPDGAAAGTEALLERLWPAGASQVGAGVAASYIAFVILHTKYNTGRRKGFNAHAWSQEAAPVPLEVAGAFTHVDGLRISGVLAEHEASLGGLFAVDAAAPTANGFAHFSKTGGGGHLYYYPADGSCSHGR